jgi:hypothetical protein
MKLASVNKILGALLLILLLLLGLELYFPGNPVADLESGLKQAPVRAEPKREIATLEPLETYEELIGRREIFRPTGPVAGVTPDRPEEKKASRLEELIKDFELTGISQGASPRAVLRSRKDGTVFFLTPGAEIGQTGIVLKEIRERTIVLSYKGEEAEL